MLAPDVMICEQTGYGGVTLRFQGVSNLNEILICGFHSDKKFDIHNKFYQWENRQASVLHRYHQT
jgi:hypothetical protein